MKLCQYICLYQSDSCLHKDAAFGNWYLSPLTLNCLLSIYTKGILHWDCGDPAVWKGRRNCIPNCVSVRPC